MREIHPDKLTLRGADIDRKFEIVEQEFDVVLNELPRDKGTNSPRGMLSKAQKKLNQYQASVRDEPDVEELETVRILLQDTISILSNQD